MAPMRSTKGEGGVGVAQMGPLFRDAGKVFQLKRVRFVKAVRPDRVDDPLALGLEPLKTSVLEEVKNVDGGAEMDARGEAAATVDLYPVERVELKWRSVRPACSGLVNPHATCFMNASLQVLFQLPPMVAWMEDLQRSSSGGGGFTGRLLRLFSQMHCGKIEVEAKELCKPSVIGQICAGHSVGKMEDAQEWLMGLLGKLHSEAVELGTKGLRSTQGAVTPETEYTSFLYRIFGGRIRTQIACRKEDFTKNVYERFASLEVELGKARTIEQALASYTKGEYLHGDNKYRLEYGPGKQDFKMVDAIKRITISEAPNVLMVLLKRFPLPGMKNSRQVDFNNTLDLKPYLSEDAKESGPCRYNLVGVVVHSGPSTQSGHYFTYAKAGNGIWHHFDDESVQPVSESVVLRAQAYVLMYIRQSQQPEPQKPKNNPCASTSSQSQAQSLSVKVPGRNCSNPEGNTKTMAGPSTQPTGSPHPKPPTVGKSKAGASAQTAVSPKSKPLMARKGPIPANGASPSIPKARAPKVAAPSGPRKSPLAVKPVVLKRKQAIGKCESADRLRKCQSVDRLRKAKGDAGHSSDGEYVSSLFGSIRVRKDLEYASDSSGDNEASPSKKPQQIRKCIVGNVKGGIGGQTLNQGLAGTWMPNGKIAGRKRLLSKDGSVGQDDDRVEKSPLVKRSRIGGAEMSPLVKCSKIGGADQGMDRKTSKLSAPGGLSPFSKPSLGVQEGPKQRQQSGSRLDSGKSPVNRRLSAACRKLSMELPIEGLDKTESGPVKNSPSKLIQTRSQQQTPHFKQTEKTSDIASAMQPPAQPSNELVKHTNGGGSVKPRKSTSDGIGLVDEQRSKIGSVEDVQQRKEKSLPPPGPKTKSFVDTGEDACSWLQGRGGNGQVQHGWSGTKSSVQGGGNKVSLKRARSAFDAEYNEEYDRGKTKKKKNKRKLFSSSRNEFQDKFDARKRE